MVDHESLVALCEFAVLVVVLFVLIIYLCIQHVEHRPSNDLQHRPSNDDEEINNLDHDNTTTDNAVSTDLVDDIIYYWNNGQLQPSPFLTIEQERRIKEVARLCLECSICMDEFDDHNDEAKEEEKDDDDLEKSERTARRRRRGVVLPRCGHRFHDACIKTWLKIKPVCPTCRQHAYSSIDHRLLLTTQSMLVVNHMMIDSILYL